MTEFRRTILLETLGIEGATAGLPSQNYFVADEAGNDFNGCMALVELGLMRRGEMADGSSVYFHATTEGIQAAIGLRVPKSAIKAWIKTGNWPNEPQRKGTTR